MNLVALTLGLLGSLHCLFMCGPLVIGVSKLSGNKGSRLLGYGLIYNVGRIMAYMSMGAVFALIGKGFSLLGLQQILSIATGILLIVLVLISLDLERFLFQYEWTQKAYKKYGDFLNRKISEMAQSSPFLLGIMNGLLPCGMVYIALAGALGTASVHQGVVFMLSFGLGTLPMMLLLMLGWQHIMKLKILNRRFVIPIGQGLLGIYLVVRGATASFPDSWF